MRAPGHQRELRAKLRARRQPRALPRHQVDVLHCAVEGARNDLLVGGAGQEECREDIAPVARLHRPPQRRRAAAAAVPHAHTAVITARDEQRAALVPAERIYAASVLLAAGTVAGGRGCAHDSVSLRLHEDEPAQGGGSRRRARTAAFPGPAARATPGIARRHLARVAPGMGMRASCRGGGRGFWTVRHGRTGPCQPCSTPCKV